MLRVKNVEIQSDSLEEIAKTSVLDAFNRCHLPVIVEDAGLFVDALKGFPGPVCGLRLQDDKQPWNAEADGKRRLPEKPRFARQSRTTMGSLCLFVLKVKHLEEYPTMKYGGISKQASGSTQSSIPWKQKDFRRNAHRRKEWFLAPSKRHTQIRQLVQENLTSA